MTTRFVTRLAILFACASVACGAGRAQEPTTQAPDPAMQQAEQTIQKLAAERNEARDTVAELANEMNLLKRQIVQLQQALNSIIPTFEAANPSKTLDPQTLEVKDKPAEPAKDGDQ